jgi:peptidase M23-like protein
MQKLSPELDRSGRSVRPDAVTIWLFALAVIGGNARAQPVTVTVTPKQPLIESTKAGQSLSFDFILKNPAAGKVELTNLRLSVFDSSGRLILQKYAGSGLSAVFPGSAAVDGKSTLLILNPFHEFRPALELAKLTYEFVFREDAKDAKEFSVEVTVEPRPFQPKTGLILPVRGRLLVYEGHDFHAHHRRVDLTNPVVAQLGVTTNPTRYAYDFCVVDDKGVLFRNRGENDEDWLGFGAPVLAPGGGIVKETRNDVDDNVLGKKMFDFRLVFQDIKAFYGNYVILDHQNGEYSLLLHLKKGSVRVKPGDRVRQGQELGQMGISGDSEFVHVHYQLQNATEINNETLPSYFGPLRWWRGKTFSLVEHGQMDSGEIVENAKK